MTQDIYTEAPSSFDTLANLGPLARLAGRWHGDQGQDTHPQAGGPETEPYVETIDFDLLDAQNNGPQVLYGLRYHVAITKPGENAAFHEQVGYLLWEPATKQVTMTLAIPRAQVAMASGTAEPGADSFTVTAMQGGAFTGIISSEFLERNFKTVEWTETFTFNGDGTLSYSEVTKLVIPGVEGVFEHKDTNTLRKTGFSRPNPRALDEGILLR